ESVRVRGRADGRNADRWENADTRQQNESRADHRRGIWSTGGRARPRADGPGFVHDSGSRGIERLGRATIRGRFTPSSVVVVWGEPLWLASCGVYPLHLSTGSGGYFRKRSSVADRPHITNSDPFDDVMRRMCTHVSHSPARVIGSDTPTGAAPSSFR